MAIWLRGRSDDDDIMRLKSFFAKPWHQSIEEHSPEKPLGQVRDASRLKHIPPSELGGSCCRHFGKTAISTLTSYHKCGASAQMTGAITRSQIATEAGQTI